MVKSDRSMNHSLFNMTAFRAQPFQNFSFPPHRSGVRVQPGRRRPGSECPAAAAGFGCADREVSGDGEIVEPALQWASGTSWHERTYSTRRSPCLRARAMRLERSTHSPVYRHPGWFKESGHGDPGAQPHAHLRAVRGVPSRSEALAAVKAPARLRESPKA